MEAKAILILVACIALVAFGFYEYRTVYNSGKQAGMEQVQTAWDQDKEAIQKVTDAAIAKATKDRDDALEANEGIKNDYEAQLLTARANATAISNQLRNYQARHTSSFDQLPETSSGLGAPAASTGQGLAKLDDALGAALTECKDNAAQLNALIAEIKPQL